MIDSVTNMTPLLAADSPTAGLKSDSDPGKQVEVLFSRMMIKEMRKAMPSDGPFGGKEMSMYMDLLDDVLAERIAESGNMGIAKQMNRSINPTDGSHLRSGSGNFDPVPTHQSTHMIHQGHDHHHHDHDHDHVAHLPNSDSRPLSGRLTSNFGKRVDPITGKARMHSGIDIAAPAGSAIQVVRDGTVTFAGEKSGYGLVVYVDHGDGLETRYAHCSKLHVKTGEKISQGHRIGDVGSTGRSTGNHLHFEARKNGKAVDPKTIFNWSEEKSTKTQPELVRQSRREGLQVSTVTRGTP